MNEIAAAGENGIDKEYALLNENFEFLEGGNGTLNLQLHWIYDAVTDEDTKKQVARQQRRNVFVNLARRLFGGGKVSYVCVCLRLILSLCGVENRC